MFLLHNTILKRNYFYDSAIDNFNLIKQNPHNSKTISRIASYAKVTSSAENCDKTNPETDPIYRIQSSELQKKFNTNKQKEDLFQQCWAMDSEFSVIHILEKNLLGYQAVYFPEPIWEWSLKQYNTLQLNCNILSYYSNEISFWSLFQKYYTGNFYCGKIKFN